MPSLQNNGPVTSTYLMSQPPPLRMNGAAARRRRTAPPPARAMAESIVCVHLLDDYSGSAKVFAAAVGCSLLTAAFFVRQHRHTAGRKGHAFEVLLDPEAQTPDDR